MINKEYEFEPEEKEATNSLNISVTTCIITTRTGVCILFSALFNVFESSGGLLWIR